MPPKSPLFPVSLVRVDSPLYLMTSQKEFLSERPMLMEGKNWRTPLILSLGKRLLGNPRIISLRTPNLLRRHPDLLVTVLIQTLILNLGSFPKFLPTPESNFLP